MGDASHGIVPFHGQGMNAGMEDCSELIRLLDEHQDDWAAAIPAFQATRIPNANAIADMALENYVTMRDSVNDEKFQLKKQLGFELEKKYPNRFVPRYSMVMFHRVPYLEALQRGVVQDSILTELTMNVNDVDRVDFQVAEKLIGEQLKDF